MTRECHVRFCERPRVKFPRPTYHRDGWAIWYKRLEAGTFAYPFNGTGRKEIAAWELGVLLEGIDLTRGRRRKRYSLPAAASTSPASEGSG